MTGLAVVPAEPAARQDASRIPVDWPIVGPLGASLICLPISRAATSLAWMALAAVMVWRATRRELRIPREMTFGIACWLITWAISIGGSPDPLGTARAWWAAASMAVPVLAVGARRDHGPLPRVVEAVWITSTLLLGVWVVVELRLGLHWLSGRYGRLSYPMMPNPNTAAQYLLLLFAWAFAGALGGRRASWWRHLAWVGAAALLAATLTRAVWPAYVVVAGFCSWRARRPIMGLAAAAAFLAGNWILPWSLWARATEPGVTNSVQFLGRLQGWVVALRMFAWRPFTGEGLGAWRQAYAVLRSPGFPVAWPHAHQFYLHVLAEAGFLGLLGFGVFLLWTFRSVWRRGWRGPDALPEELGMTAALLGTALVALVDMTWVGEPGYAFLALAAFALGRRG